MPLSQEAVVVAARATAGLLARHVWKYLVLLFILANIKSLPLMWHLRFFNGFYGHRPPFGLRRRKLSAGKIGPAALFRPVCISSHAPLAECDLLGHKSNSTYFSDLDMGRLHLVMLVFYGAVDRARPSRTDNSQQAAPPGEPGVHLGGVTCLFRREIKPYKRYDIWTRVLSWDEKWIYVVSHIVRKDAIKPKTYLLQPDGPSRGWWPFSLLQRQRERRLGDGKVVTPPTSSKEANGAATGSSTTTAGATPHPAIYASSIAKYVCKRGRVTVSPERVLRLAGLLPPRDSPSVPSDSPDDPNTTVKHMNTGPQEAEEEKIPSTIERTIEEKEEAILKATLLPKDDDVPSNDDGTEKWDWSRVEAERQRGLHLASLLAGMDGLHGMLEGDDGIVLGHYSDIF